MNTATRSVSRLRASLAALTLLVLAFAGLTVSALPASAAEVTTTAGSLNWGFKQTWRDYIAGVPTGSTVASNGATASGDGTFVWPAGASTFAPETGAGSAAFGGTVQFLKPGHGIDRTIANPRVTFAGDGTGSLYWTYASSEVLGASLSGVAVSAPVVSGAQSTVTVTTTGGLFTAAGGAPFTYLATDPIDPLSFTLTYATPSIAAPTVTTLAVSSTTVAVGGVVELTSTVTAGAPGSVTFFDGTTSLATIPVTAGAASTLTTPATAGSHSYTALFAPSNAADWAASTSAAAVVAASATPAVVTGNVTGASLDWGFSQYAQVGATLPAGTAAATGWAVTASGGATKIGAVGNASAGFRLNGGTGQVDAGTGLGTISYPGAVSYNPNANAAFALSDFRLSLTSATQGVLTGTITVTSVAGVVTGPIPTTFATFGVASLTGSDGAFALTTAAPDYAGTVAVGTYNATYGNAWPVSFISAIPAAYKSYFYQTSGSQGNLNKPPLPITASYTAVIPATATTVTLAASSATVVAGGSVELSAKTTAAIAGTVEFFEGATSLGTSTVASAAAVKLVTAITVGTHSYTATFTPTDTAHNAVSTSAAVPVASSALPAVATGNVTGASLDWGFSQYAQVGAALPAGVAAASGWAVATSGGATKIGAVGAASAGFRLSDGTGQVDAGTGIGTISYPGTVSYNPNANASFALSDFRLTLATATQGVLTGSLTVTSVDGVVTGPFPVTFATFAVASLTNSSGAFALTTAAPDYVGTVAVGTYNATYGNAWPVSLVSVIPAAYKAYFYQTSGSQGNLNKPPLPITASFTAAAPAAPTTVVVTVGSTTVITGGSVELSAKTTAAVPGTVEFFDGATSLVTSTVASAAAGAAVTAIAAGTHSYTATFTPANTVLYAVSTSAAVSVVASAGAAVVTGNVTGASLDWGFSPYAQVGAAIPAGAAAATGWAVTTSGGATKIGAVGNASAGFRLSEGTGQVDATSGLGTISYPGAVSYNPNANASFELSGFTLTLASATQGVLTGTVTVTSVAGVVTGPIAVTFATFAVASLAGTEGAFALTTAAPDYAGTVAVGTYNASYGNAWPVSFITAIPAAYKSYFYQTSGSQGNLNKPPLPITANYTATVPATATGLDWAIKQSFTTYVLSTTANGTITLDGATVTGGIYGFAPTAGSTYDSTVKSNSLYSGGVHFVGHGGALDLNFANPSVAITSSTAATLSFAVNGAASSSFAALDLTGATVTTDGPLTRYSSVPAVLTASGAASFAGFYAAGTVLDTVSFTVDTSAPASPPTPVTTSTLTATPAAITVGESTTLAAQVAPAVAGQYTFRIGASVLGTVAVNAQGSARFVVQNLPVGTFAATATFTPTDADLHTGSVASASITVAAVTVPVVVPPVEVGAGSLTWGVKQSFRDYVVGPIAQGAISTSGVSTTGGQFMFGQADGGTYDRATGVGTSNYSGSVRFTGHAGLLDLTLGNPVVRVDSATSATLLVNSGGRQVAIAALNLAGGSLSTPNNTVTYTGVPASLTSQGVAVFSLNGSGFYPAGTALDAVSFVIGAPKAAATGTTTVATFAAVNTPAATAPSTTGITIQPGTALTENDEVTITASGFAANEKNILAVIYSDPIVLSSTVIADATGTASWTGRLPNGLVGAHTLTLQGSVDRGVQITIAAKAATAAVVGCVVDDASLTWGFKESFRSYISGSIANGQWTVANGATYTVPNFGFSAGVGGYDQQSGEGSIAYTGSITFTGHAGVLNTTVANPQLRFTSSSTAVLLLDVSGTTQDGATVDQKGVEFADVDLSGVLVENDGSYTITAAPATLTDAGSAAFGTYAAGEALDPITATFSTASDCATPAAESVPRTTAEASAAAPAKATADLGWIVWALVALFVLAALVTAIVAVVRRRAATR